MGHYLSYEGLVGSTTTYRVGSGAVGLSLWEQCVCTRAGRNSGRQCRTVKPADSSRRVPERCAHDACCRRSFAKCAPSYRRWHYLRNACRLFAVGVRLGAPNHIFACESPDGELTAIFYVRQAGGAAGSQSEYVSVRPRGDAAEVLLFEMGHGYNVRLTWTGSRQLTIGYPKDANMFAWRNRFRRQVAGRFLDVDLTPVESKNGLFPTKEDECVVSGAA